VESCLEECRGHHAVQGGRSGDDHGIDAVLPLLLAVQGLADDGVKASSYEADAEPAAQSFDWAPIRAWSILVSSCFVVSLARITAGLDRSIKGRRA
jgi:hypothetical protein